jgi:hypothetical protein
VVAGGFLWSGPALIMHIGSSFSPLVGFSRKWGGGCWWWSLGVGAGCRLRTAQWTRTSFSSGVRRVDNPLMIRPFTSGWVVCVFVVWVHVYRLDPRLLVAAVVLVVVGGVWWSSV